MSTKFLSPGWRMPRNANQSKSSNYSMDFNGSSQYVDTGNSVLHTSNATVFTLSAWIKPKAGMSLGIIAADAPAASPTNGGFWIGYDNRNTATRPANGISYNIKTSTGYQSGKSNDNAITINVWNHVVLVLDGQATLYINGVSSTSRISDNIGDLVTQSHELLLGTEDTLSFEFNGLITEVSIFDYALSPSQVTTLWGGRTSVSNPMALPSPPIAYYPLGTSAWNGEYLAENNAIGDYVFDFDGVNDVVNITNSSEFNLGTSFTISGWFNFSSNKYQGLISFDSSSTRGWFLYQLNYNSIRLYDGTNAFTLKTSYTNTNQWDNFILNYNGTSLVFYINGLQESTQNVSINLQTNGNDGQIGNNQAGSGRYFNGKMSNVQIFNTALSLTEVETLYNNGSPIRTLANIPQNSNLKAWYKLDASEVYNSSTTEWEVNEATSPWTSSLDFDGNNDYIDCGTGSRFNIDQITISAWVKRNSSIGDYATVAGIRNTSNGPPPYIINLPTASSKEVKFIITQSNSTLVIVNSNTLIQDDTWYHVVGVADGSNVKLYVNGDLQTDQKTYDGTIISPTQNFNIGRIPSTANYYWDGQISNVAVFDTGLSLSQVETIYNNGSPLTSMSGFTSLQGWWKLNNTTTGIEDSKGSNNGTNNGATEIYGSVSTLNGESSGMSQANLVQSNLQTVAPYSKYALDFDGTNDYIDLNFQSQTTPATISIWVNTDVNDSQQRYAIINGRADQQPAVYLRMQSDNTYQVFISNTNGFDTLQANSATVNTWFHFAIVCENSQTLLYENGTLKDSSTIGWSGIDIDQSNNWQLGRDSRGQRYWNGSISNVSIWNTAFTSSQVTEIYNEGLPSNLNSHSAYSNLVSWWQLGENSSFDGNDWIVADEKGSNNGTSTGMPVGALTNGVGTTANGVSSGMSEGNLVGDAPYSTANAISSNMVVTSRVTGSGNTP